MKKKLIALVLAVTVLVGAIVGGTLAYLSDTDSAVNVATVGNVKIKQHEMQRDGSELVPFVQGQKLYPAYPSNNSDYTLGNDGFWSKDLVGTMDKIVTVENTGRSDLYFRTWVAFECPDSLEYEKDIIANLNTDAYTWAEMGEAEIDGVDYVVLCGTYKANDGILAPKTTSPASLKQVVMHHTVGNEEVADCGETYEILVFSQAVQTENMPNAAAALTAAFGTELPWLATDYEMEVPSIITNEKEFDAALSAAGAPKSGNTTLYLADDIELTEAWESIKVDGYNGAGVVTIEGQGHTITGLTAPLFKGGFAGKSGIIIKDLTIADSNITSSNTQGAGAFIECVDSMPTITLDNCHLINSTVYAPDARTGGLIGWTSGYSAQDDGPVKTYVTITDCSVVDCEITGTSVGAINGHAGASDWTFTTIDNCVVTGNTLTSTDDGGWRVGAIVGTANSGQLTISNVTVGNNVMTQAAASSQRATGLSDMIGRTVFNNVGSCNIEGNNTVLVSNNAGIVTALKYGYNTIVLADGTYVLPGSITGAVTIKGTSHNTVIDMTKTPKLSLNDSDVTFENLTVKGTNQDDSGFQHAGDMVYNNVVFNDSMYLYGTSETFNDCVFNNTSSYVWTYAAPQVAFNNCVFNTQGKAILVYKHGGTFSSVVNVNNCTFNANAKGETWDKQWVSAVEVDASRITGTYTVNFTGTNYVSENFSGLCRIKNDASFPKVTINGADTAVASVATKDSFTTALNNAQPGDTVVLGGDLDFSTTQFVFDKKDVTIDLGGNELNLANNYGGMTVTNGASIKNGIINHTGNTAAIKISGTAGTIENVTINMTPTAGKTKTGIQVYNGKYVEAIKNVTITGVTQGIEVAKGSRVDLIENVKVTAIADGAKKGVALLVNAASVGKAVNCTFESDYGVYMMLNGEFDVALELENCVVTGSEAAFIAHDEAGISNTINCSLTFAYDSATKFNGDFIWNFEDECKGVVSKIEK